LKPRNFPGRKLRRVAVAKANSGAPLSAAEATALIAPKDIRQRIGRSRRTQEGPIHA